MKQLPRIISFIFISVLFGSVASLRVNTQLSGFCRERESSSSSSSKLLISQTSRSRIISHILSSTITNSGDDFTSKPSNLVLADPVKYGPLHFKFKGKVLTVWGLLYAVIILLSSMLSLPLMAIFTAIAEVTGNGKRRRLNDWVVHYWAKVSLLLSLCRPTLIGRDNLPPSDQVVVYVPNHTSYFDILLLSGFVPRPFKYLSKSEILDIPFVGAGMRLAKHVFLKRNDIKSTIEVADTCIDRLRDGNSMVLFAEGTRSLDGSLKKFKKGAFQMAKAAGVPVVPVSIGNLYRWMPPFSILPLAPIRHTYIQIHPAINTTDKSVREIKKLCFEAVNSGLPPHQRFDKEKDKEKDKDE